MSKLRNKLASIQKQAADDNIEAAYQLENFRGKLEELTKEGRQISKSLSSILGPNVSGRFDMYIVNKLANMASDSEMFTFGDTIEELENMDPVNE